MHQIKQRFLQITLWLVCIVGLGQVVATEKITYYHTDILGSPIAATDKDGNVLWRENYKPYGERLKEDDMAKASENTVWYTGHAEDRETDLIYMGARWYDPVLGRFMSIDPVGVDLNNVHSFNRYAYANNNPYTFVDPDGRIPVVIWWIGKSLVEGFGDVAIDASIAAASGQSFGIGDAADSLITGTALALVGLGTIKKIDRVGDVTKNVGGFGKLFQQRAQTLREASIEFNRVGKELQVPGGLAGAIKHTRQTGKLVGGSDHVQKGRDAVRFYNRQIKQIGNSRGIPEAGQQRLIDIATRSRDKIQNALNGN